MGKIRSAFAQLAAMPHPRRRRHHDAGATVVQTPAQLGVLAVEVDRRIEAPEGPEQIGADQEIGRRQDEDVADAVVLFLVDLAGSRSTGSISPKRSMPSPTACSTRGSSQSTNLGPTAPAFER